MTVKDLWFSPGTPVSSTNKTDRLDIAEILLKVALNTIYHKTIYSNINQTCLKEVGTAYPSRALGFTPGFFWWGPCLFSSQCCVFTFVCLRHVSCLPLFVFVTCLVYLCLSSSRVLFTFVCLRHVSCLPLFVFVTCLVYLCLSSSRVLFTFVCLRHVSCLPLFVFVTCLVYLCLSSSRVLFTFVCLRHVSCLPLFVFVTCLVYLCLSSSRVLFTHCFQCLWIVHSCLPLRFSLTFIFQNYKQSRPFFQKEIRQYRPLPRIS